MTSDASAGEEPIDAEFEPAPPEASSQTQSAQSPGWLGVGVASVAAACIGGLIGVFAHDPQSSARTAELEAELDQLVSAQQAIETELTGLERAVETTTNTLQQEVEALVSGDEETAGLEALVNELEAISARLDEAGDPQMLADITARLEILEQADENEAVSPRQMNRAVTALRDRVEDAEGKLANIQRGLDIRAEAMAALTTRIARLETAGPDASEEITQTLGALQEQLAAMRSDIASVREAASDTGEAEAASRAVEAAAVRARAALAFVELRERAGRGDGFTQQLARVREALPDDPSVEVLQAFAQDGAPDLAALASGFAETREQFEAEVEDSARSDGWGWVRRAFGGAVTVRREGEANAAGDVLDETASALAAGDLEAAIAGIETLEDSAAEAFEDWLRDARMRRDMDAGLTALNDAMRRAGP